MRYCTELRDKKEKQGTVNRSMRRIELAKYGRNWHLAPAFTQSFHL
jgi:hypothetical protein